MAEGTYRLVYMQNGLLDHVSEIVMSNSEAWQQLGMSRALHVITGWEVSDCICGSGFVAEKDGVRRSEHVEHIDRYAEEDIESVALAVGILSPAARNGLVLV